MDKIKSMVNLDNHLLFEEGMKDEIYGKQQVRLGGTEEELDKILSSLDFMK